MRGSIITLLVTASLVACQTTDDSALSADDCLKSAAIPPGATVSEPSSDVPGAMAAFSGMWGRAKWDNSLCHTLVVDRINPDGTVSFTYIWGTFYPWNISSPGRVRAQGIIKDGTLSADMPNGAHVEYRLDGDTLKGSYTNRGGTVHTRLAKLSQ